MQVHNLLAWREFLKTLPRWKDEGRTRLLGVTTAHDSKHDEMERLLKAESHTLKFMQITHSLVDRPSVVPRCCCGRRPIAVSARS